MHTIALLIAMGSVGRGHLVLGELTLHGDIVRLAAFFEDDLPANNAKVRVVDNQGAVVVEGVTDAEKGLFEFPAPPAGKYRILLDAGQGHRTTLDLELNEVDGRRHLGPAATRQSQTAYPYLKVVLGLGLIGLVVAVFLLSRRTSS